VLAAENDAKVHPLAIYADIRDVPNALSTLLLNASEMVREARGSGIQGNGSSRSSEVHDMTAS
jgi:hypothetical protein